MQLAISTSANDPLFWRIHVITDELMRSYTYGVPTNMSPEVGPMYVSDPATTMLGITSFAGLGARSSVFHHDFGRIHAQTIKFLEKYLLEDGIFPGGTISVWRLEQDFVDRHRAGSFVPVPDSLLSPIVPLLEQDDDLKQSRKGWHATQLRAKRPNR